MSKTEVQRIEDGFKHPSVTIACLGCGREIVLWFNGGELDLERCCGYVYEGEHVRVDLVIYREDSDQ